ncbi:MAG: ABC-F family ATP-binding cassette domain-containing protein [Candidatus Pacebacteria bacterium]|jgi:ATP-binding cassette subfamily F protein 3|nr:ABC-F family ATP-binding cassette domain-containing protein [Candidatus Paceibacterota bacterium]
MENQNILSLKNIKKYIGLRELFSDASFNVHERDKIAIVGQNGKGKTTLLKIILGAVEFDEGEIDKSKSLRIGYLSQNSDFADLENTLEEEILSADDSMYEIIKRKTEIENLLESAEGEKLEQILKDYEDIVEKYETRNGYEYEAGTEKTLRDFRFKDKDFARKVKSLSGGEKTRLGLAKLALQDPDLLILDEPTNHLDLETIVWLENFLFEWSKAIVLVSHDRYFLDKVCDKTFEIYNGKIRKFHTNYSGYLEERDKIMEIEEEQYSRQQKYLGKQEKFIEKFRYKPTKSSAVQSRIKMLDKIEKVEKPEDDTKQMRINYNIKNRLPSRVMDMEDIIVSHGDKLLVEIGGKIEIYNDAKIGIIGSNGAGKTSFIKTMMQKAEERNGVEFAHKIRIGYYAQSHENLDYKKDILENIREVCDLSDEKIRNALGCLLFTGDDVYKKVADLSGGEKAKVSIAKLILGESNFLILDEPTNHLDIESRQAMVNFLKTFDGPIMLISHDRFVLNEVCNQIWEIKYQKLNRILGNYDRYADMMKGY